ncbi:MAG TPA: group II truncated hemoglobin [Sphingobium sp.]|nr:group II truncated hemoglobin [Sphingobium sp.]
MSATAVTARSPFDAIGGEDAVRRLVDRFYDLMDGDPAYQALRHLHAPDLAPMRRSLTGFLTGWLGGPRHWFDANPGRCMMSLHAPIAIDKPVADQWVAAMGQALRDTAVDPALADQIAAAFARMATNMVRN